MTANTENLFVVKLHIFPLSKLVSEQPAPRSPSNKLKLILRPATTAKSLKYRLDHRVASIRANQRLGTDNGVAITRPDESRCR